MRGFLSRGIKIAAQKGAAEVRREHIGRVARGVARGAVMRSVNLDWDEKTLTRAAANGILSASMEVGSDARRQALEALADLKLVLSKQLQ